MKNPTTPGISPARIQADAYDQCQTIGRNANEIASDKRPVTAPIIGPKMYPVSLTGRPPAANLKDGIAAIGAIFVNTMMNATEVAIKTETNAILRFVHCFRLKYLIQNNHILILLYVTYDI